MYNFINSLLMMPQTSHHHCHAKHKQTLHSQELNNSLIIQKNKFH
jgi:hypothetical protein